MNGTRARRSGFTLIELLVVVAIIALLVSILLPSLGRAKEMTQAVVCSNRLKASFSGFNFYGGEFKGTFIAPYDYNAGVQLGDRFWTFHWPYTMVHYVTGGSISDGYPVYWPDAGGWYGPEGRGGRPSWEWEWITDPDSAPQLQCPTLVSLGGIENPIWHSVTSFSYAIPLRKNDTNDLWQSELAAYPKPDYMTHPSSTVHMMDMGVQPGADAVNCWANAYAEMVDPHMGKSNYTFYDGHVETLSEKSTNERMWADQWERDDTDVPWND